MAEPNLTADFRESPTGNVNPAIAPLVYTKTRWEDPWVFQKYLYCDNATWALNPGTSSAQLSWKYGLVQQAGTLEEVLFPPASGARVYVKIDIPYLYNQVGGTFEGLTWYGIVNGMATKAGGVRNFGGELVETGAQAIHCVGMEKLLDDTIIRTSAWSDAGTRYYIDRGLTFNYERADGKLGGNMATGGNWVEGVPLYSGVIRDDDEFWTTPNCLKYLVAYHPPKDRAGTELPLRIDPDGLALLLWTRDRPNIPTHGRTLREVLNQLLPHERFVSWYLDVVEDALVIKIVSLTGNTIVLPSADVLEANPRRWLFDIDASRGDGVLTLSHAEAVDRVRVQGARATSTFSISYADSTLEARYTTAQKTLYDTGATGSTPYTAATTDEVKLRLHKARRAQADCHMVYSHFGIPDDWDGVAKNGEGAGGFDFCPIETETTGFKFYNRELFVEPTTALRDGYVYTALGGTGTPVAPVKSDTGGPHNFLPIQVWMKVPQSGAEESADDRWVNIEKIGMAADTAMIPDDPEWTFSAHVTVPQQDRALLIKVAGGEQYVIAGTDYTKKDEEPDYTPWDWKQMIVTLTVKWDAFCEGVYPDLVDVTTRDHIREVVLSAGDEYKLDWLVPQTVVSLDTDGQLVRSTLGGWIQDDRTKLKDRAQMAFLWYGVERRSIQLPTSKINGSVKLGDYVVGAGVAFTKPVNTVITSIRFDSGPGEAVPMLFYVTDYIADLDLFLTPNLEAAIPKAPTAPAAAAPARVRTWETEVPAGPAPEVPKGLYSVQDFKSLGGRIFD